MLNLKKTIKTEIDKSKFPGARRVEAHLSLIKSANTPTLQYLMIDKSVKIVEKLKIENLFFACGMALYCMVNFSLYPSRHEMEIQSYRNLGVATETSDKILTFKDVVLTSGKILFSIVEILAFIRSRDMVEKFSSLRSLSYKKVLKILEELGYDINSNNNDLNKVFENITKLDASELSKIESFLILEKEKLLEIVDWANSNLENEKVLKKLGELANLRSEFIKNFEAQYKFNKDYKEGNMMFMSPIIVSYLETMFDILWRI